VLVARVFDGVLSAGTPQELVMNGESWASGFYTVRLEGPDGVLSRAIILTN